MPLDSFPELQLKMQSFQEKFCQTLRERQDTLQGELQEYSSTLAQLKSERERLTLQLEHHNEERAKVLEQLEMESHHREATGMSLANLQKQKETLDKEYTDLKIQASQLSQGILDKRAAISRQMSNFTKQSQSDLPELALFEKLLGLTVDTTKPDELKFAFVNVDELGTKVWCVLDVSGECQVTETFPNVDCQAIVDDLNKSGDFTRFLKNVRTKLKNGL